MANPKAYPARQGPYQHQLNHNNPFANPPHQSPGTLPRDYDADSDLGDSNYPSPNSSTTRLAAGSAFYDSQNNGILFLPSN